MFHTIAAVSFSVLFLLSHVTPASCETDRHTTEELLKKSGLSKQIEQIPGLVEAGFSQGQVEAQKQGRDLPDESYQTILKAIAGSFDPRLITLYMTRQIDGQLSPEDTRAVFKWLDSPLGTKITHLEETSSSAEAYKEMLAMADKLLGPETPPERLRLIRQIDSASKATASSTDLAINMQIAITSALVSALPTPDAPSLDAIAAHILGSRPQIEREVSEQVLMNMVYTYRSLTDSELKKYLAFIVSEPGQRYNDVMLKGFNTAMAECSRRSGDAIKRVVDGDAWDKIQKDIARPLGASSADAYPQKGAR